MNKDWIEVEIHKLGEIITGGTPPKKDSSNYDSNDYPFFKPTDLNQGINTLESNDHLSEKAFFNSRKAPKNSILVTCIGATIGKTGLIKNEGAFNQQINAIIPFEFVDNKFLFYQIISQEFQNRIKDNSSSTTLPILNKSKFSILPSKLGPLPEQRAIVSRIEELFSDLDHAISNLKSAQAKLEIYRQAALKKAFEGELTSKWREKQCNLVSADKLVKGTNVKRQKYFEQQLENWGVALRNWKINGRIDKKPVKPKASKSIEEFTERELEKMDTLPNVWQWVRLGNLFDVFVGSTPSRRMPEYWENGTYNWVSSGEVNFSSIFYTKEKITVEGLNNASTSIHPIGTVMLAMIGEGKTRGQAGILEIPACHNQNTAAIRVSEIGFPPKFLFYYFLLKYEKNRGIGSGNNQKALNQAVIRSFDYPLCSIEEQFQIVQEIESRFSVADKLAETIQTNLQKSESLRQSILKKAFEGKLLTDSELEACRKEADWEPAEKLLERIKGEKKKK